MDVNIPLRKFLVTDLEGYQIYKHTLHQGRMIPYIDTLINFAECPAFTALLNEYSLVLKKATVKNNTLALTIETEDGTCPVCCVTHETKQNLYALIKGKFITIRCFQ